jgi:DNA primase
MDESALRAEVSKGGRSTTTPAATANRPVESGAASIERTALKCVLQAPAQVGEWFGSLEASLFTIPAAAAVFTACYEAGDPLSFDSPSAWLQAVLDASPNDEVKSKVRELAVDPLPVDQPDERYVQAVLARILEMDASRRINELKAVLQRSSIDGDPDEQNQILTDLLSLEQYRRDMREYSVGDQ